MGLEERFNHLDSVNLHVDQALGLSRRELILLDRLNGFVDPSRPLLRFVVDEAALGYPVQALHDRRLN